MSESQALRLDILFVGLTRVPMILGVPYAAFVLEFMVATIANIVTGNPLYMLVLVPIHAVFYLVSLHDPGIFSEMLAWMKTIGRCLNGRFWQAASFSPLRVRKWQR